MKVTKRLITLMLCVCIFAVNVPAALAADTPSDWAKESVNAAVGLGLVPSSLQSNYTQATTRAEFCALAVGLYEAFKGTITDRVTFNDTSDTNVEKAAAIGVVSGVGNNKFDPNANLTREQAATMLARLADKIGKTIPVSAASFNDKGNVSSWAAESVGQMQASGIMGGVGDNRFAPKDSYTREQSISTILRVFTFKNLVDTIPPYNTETTSTYYDAYYPTVGSKSISLGGKSYKNAIMLYSSIDAKISFNLEGKHSTVSGIIGPVDDMALHNTTVNVYGDGKLLQTFEVPKSGLPSAFTINVSGVRDLVFEALGNCRVGAAELMLDVKGASPSQPTTPTTPDPTTPSNPEPTTPSEPTTPVSTPVNLVDTIPPYNTETTSTYYDSYYPTTGNKSITMGGKSYKNAIMLYSSSNAKISFNIEGKYTTLSGTIGPVDNVAKFDTTVNIYGDGKLLQTFEVPKSGLPTSFSIDVSGVKDLVFEAIGNCAVGAAELKIQ